MSPRSSEQLDDIRKQKKELIMGVALELFAENGYHVTSVSQIAKKAGISKGLTYNYFESKKELLEALVAHGFEEIFNSFDLNHDGVLTVEEFKYFIRQNFKLLSENLPHWKLFFSLLLQPVVADSFSKQYGDKMAPLLKIFNDFIISQGSKDPEGSLMAIAAMLEGAFLYVVVAPEAFPVEILQEKIIDACFKIINN